MVAARLTRLSTLDPHRTLALFSFSILCISVVVALLRIILFDVEDPLHCESLTNSGRWLDIKSRSNWQPDGCMLRNYNSRDVDQCLSDRDILFVGDSITRQLYFSFTRLADTLAPPSPEDGHKHADYNYTTSSGINFYFHWDPFLNSSRTFDVLTAFKTSQHRAPALLFLGSGLWYLRYFPAADGIAVWEDNMKSLIDMLKSSKVTDISAADLIIILPVQKVIYSKLSADRAESLHESDIDAMNAILIQQLQRNPVYGSNTSEIKLYPKVALPTIFNGMLDSNETIDGLHFSEHIVKQQANLLLNFRCNDALPKIAPHDRTCCYRYPTPSVLQTIVIISAIAWAPLVQFWGQKLKWPAALLDKATVNSAVTIGLSAGLMFVADRTGFWLKEHKQFDSWSVALIVLGVLGLGVLRIEKAEKDLGFLNRQQTDEWKGWMQIIILIYHYFGASKIDWIYKPVRVFVASYLFMTGYGHTSYYLSQKANFSFQRFAQILIRLNLFTLLLTYVMDTNYDSYYFTPLISLWYIIIYATLSIGHSYNRNIIILLGKVLLSMVFISTIMSSVGLIQSTFDFLGSYANIHWSAKESFFRVNLDLYIVYAGMLAAIAAIRIRTLHLVDTQNWRLVRHCATGLSILSLVGYVTFEQLQPSKYTYNFWHPYVSFIPIVAFVILRNSTSSLRSLHSKFFAFVGKCSLETFIIQFHFWLAADTKGILLFIPGEQFRTINFLFSSTVFIALSYYVSNASSTLTERICSSMSTADKIVELSLSTFNDPSLSAAQNHVNGHKDEATFIDDSGESGVSHLNRVSGFKGWCTKFLRSTFDAATNFSGFWFGNVLGRCTFFAILLWLLNITWSPSE